MIHEKMVDRMVIALAVLLQLSRISNAVDKIYINPKTRLYTGRGDGRVHIFHGLAIEDSSFPWTLAQYSEDQIETMKEVNILKQA